MNRQIFLKWLAAISRWMNVLVLNDVKFLDRAIYITFILSLHVRVL